jgi:hypothetical protein
MNIPASAQENILFFLGNTPQSSYLNPAHKTDRSKVVIGLPIFSGIYFSINNSISVNDFATLNNGVLTIDLDDLIPKAPQNNYLSENFTLPLFDFQLRLKNRTFTFGIFENQLMRSGFDKNLLRIINEGNYPWLGSTISTNFDFNFLHYREYALGYSQPFSDKLTFGTRVKLLTGMSTFDVRQMNLGIETGGNMEYLRIHATGEYEMSLPLSINYIEGEDSPNNEFDIIDYITNTSNLGVALDLGVTYQLLPALEVSASLINLGFINWKSNATTVSHGGSFTWNGFDLSNIENEREFNEEPYYNPLESLIDSISGIINLRNEPAPFNAGIPTKIYLAAGYEVSKFFSAGLVDRIMLYDNQVSHALTLSGNLKLGTIFSLSAGYSIIDNSFDNLSLGTALKLGPFQIYCLTDNILAFNVMNAQNFNIRFGMNFMFGKKIVQ